MAGNGPFVIRPQTPLKRVALLRLAMLGIGLFALYVAFEFGRYSVGYDRVLESEKDEKVQQQLRDLQRENHDLRTQLAAFDNERAGLARERAAVASQITELQAQIDRDRQDLAVYRGVVSPASQGSSVQVQQLRITDGDTPQQYRVHLTLMQSGRPDTQVNGSVQVRVKGDGAGGSVTVSASGAAAPSGSAPESRQPATPPAATVTFSFRYYQALEYSVQLPAGLKPQRVEVELRPGHPAAPAVTQSFPWKVDPT